MWLLAGIYCDFMNGNEELWVQMDKPWVTQVCFLRVTT